MIRTGTDKLMDYAHYHKPFKSKNTITKSTHRRMRKHPANTDHNVQRLDSSSREHNLRQSPEAIPDQGRTTKYPPCRPWGIRSQTVAPVKTAAYRAYFRYHIYVDLTHLPDETTPCASAEPLEATQMDTTAEPLESEGDYIRRCYQQVTTILGIDMDKFLCLREAQLVTDSILEVALERQLNPQWGGDGYAPHQ